jgi:hypothetical protein
VIAALSIVIASEAKQSGVRRRMIG